MPLLKLAKRLLQGIELGVIVGGQRLFEHLMALLQRCRVLVEQLRMDLRAFVLEALAMRSQFRVEIIQSVMPPAQIGSQRVDILMISQSTTTAMACDESAQISMTGDIF